MRIGAQSNVEAPKMESATKAQQMMTEVRSKTAVAARTVDKATGGAIKVINIGIEQTHGDMVVSKTREMAAARWTVLESVDEVDVDMAGAEGSFSSQQGFERRPCKYVKR